VVAILQPLKSSRPIPIDRAVVLVGRAENCDVVISGSQKISRRHCCLVQSDENYYIRDLGSTNGVWINGKRVDMQGLMVEGDHIAIGDVQFRFYPNGAVRPAPVKKPIAVPRADLTGSGIEIPDLEDASLSSELDDSAEDVPSIELTKANDVEGPASVAQLPDNDRPIESEPIINLDENYGDQEIEDIIMFDDE